MRRQAKVPLYLPWGALVLVLCLPACAPRAQKAAEPLALSLQDIAPHHDRDHFVYVWVRMIEGDIIADGIQVEHLTAVGDSGEFDVSLTESGMGLGQTRYRDDGHALLLVREGLGPGLQVTYAPPLPQLAVPLLRGTQESAATGTVHWLADGERVESLPVTQTVEARSARPVQSLVGDYTQGVVVRTVRTWQFTDGPLKLTTTAVLVPGIGELRSEGKASGAPALYRELACATIDGRPLGDCRTLNETLEAYKRAGPTHIQ